MSSNADDRFVGKTIVITGAGGQFGRAGCLYFAQRGANVAALDLNAQALAETNHPAVVTFVCNVTKEQEVADTVQKIVERFASIDLLWNNAGYQGQISNTLDYSPTDFGNVMNVNVTGMFIVLQAVAKSMVASSSRHSAIVNTASVAGLRGTPGMIAYASSKAAVVAMTVTAAKDLAPHGIRVNAVSPALIGPGMMWERQNQLHAALGPPFFADTPEQVATNKIGSVPLKRLGTVEEVIETVAFLLSSQSSYTTGTNLVVDGGLAAGMK